MFGIYLDTIVDNPVEKKHEWMDILDSQVVARRL